MFLSIVESKYSTRKKCSAQRLFQGDKMYVHLQSNLTPTNDQLGVVVVGRQVVLCGALPPPS